MCPGLCSVKRLGVGGLFCWDLTACRNMCLDHQGRYPGCVSARQGGHHSCCEQIKPPGKQQSPRQTEQVGRWSDFPKHITVNDRFSQERLHNIYSCFFAKSPNMFWHLLHVWWSESRCSRPPVLSLSLPHQHTARPRCFLSFIWVTKADWAWVLTAQQPCGRGQVASLSETVFKAPDSRLGSRAVCWELINIHEERGIVS